VRIIQEDPGHSAAYAQRFRDMVTAGVDLVGEARLVDALVPRGTPILDAGCGPAGWGRSCTMRGTRWSRWTSTRC
jgi:hypothetical protein